MFVSTPVLLGLTGCQLLLKILEAHVVQVDLLKVN